MEVRLKRKGAAPGTKEDLRLMTVDNHWDTLRWVQDNMEECVGNIVRLKRLQEREAKGVAESAALFQKNLEPLVASLAAANGQGVMDKLSASLKKALLLMVMERYQRDREKACRVLGISREKLESELKLCGVR
jgi:DNA-binding protein Fis